MDFGVRMPELEVCIVVVELPDQPGIGIVASGAILSQTCLMHIVGAMTVDAYVARVAENGGGMAGLTTERSVLAYERETAQIMVKSNLFLPGNFVVALAALFTLLIFVNIVLLVAAVTGGINFLGFGADRMACLANQAFMRTNECKIGVCVVVEFSVRPT